MTVLPKAERPAPHADQHGGVLDRKVQLPSPATQLRRQRIVLLAAEFGFTRPQRHPNARYQKGYGTQKIVLHPSERFLTLPGADLSKFAAWIVSGQWWGLGACAGGRLAR